MTQLTDKTWFIYSKGFQVWLNDNEAEIVRKAIDQKLESLDIDGRRLKTNDCILLKGEDNDRAEKIKRGNWMCAWGQWHTKDEQCGHDSAHKF